MKLYRTTRGAVLEEAGRTCDLPAAAWDELINDVRVVGAD